MITYFSNLINKKKKLVVGLMSGTSIDGIDAALVEIDGHGLMGKFVFPGHRNEKNIYISA